MQLKRIISSILALTCVVASIHTVTAGKGGGRRNNNNNNNGKSDDKMDWYDTLAEAMDWAKKNKKPVMLVVRRAANRLDTTKVQKMSTWQALTDASSEKFAAVQGAPRQDEIKQVAQLAGVKTLPAIVWLDQYGNPVKTQPVPDTVNPIAEVVNSWPTLIGNIEKSLKEKVARGEKFASQGHLHEAYTELSSLASYKGPMAEAAQKARDEVKQKWTQLAELGTKQPAGSRERAIILDGLMRETQGTDFEPEMQKILAAAQTPDAAVAAGSPAADAKPATPTAVAAIPEKPAKPAADKPATAGGDDANDMLDANANGKTLAEVSAAPAASASTSDSGVKLNTDLLAASTDPKMKDAAKLLQDGMTAYRQATADSMERGTQRNNLLKSAYDSLSKSSTILQESVEHKADPRIEKMLQQISMMMYGCMKYQSLN